MYLTKDEFLQKFGILPQEFEEADISWEELLEIADDYERRRPTLEKIRKEFVAEFLQDKEKEIGLQSYHSRLKDTATLLRLHPSYRSHLRQLPPYGWVTDFGRY